MKKKIITNRSSNRYLPLVAGLFTSFAAFAGTANVHVYWTRGFDGTGLFDETLTNNVFTENGGSVFSDRLINGANNISDLDKLGVVNSETGARTDDSITADYTNDGSVYLHIGYINSGFTGSGSELQNINLNGDLVVGRVAIENVYSRNGSTLKTANLSAGITAGDSDYTLSFDYTGSADIFFFRDGGSDTSLYSTSFAFDCNVVVPTAGVTATGLFSVKSNNHLIFGSVDHKRTLTVQGDSSVSYARRLFSLSEGGSVTSYSDMVISGGVRYLFEEAAGSIYLNGDILWEVKNLSNHMSLIHTSASSTSSTEIEVNGKLTVDVSSPSSSIDIFYLNGAGNVLTVDGDIHVKNLSAKGGSSFVVSNNVDQKITFNGDITMDKFGDTATSGTTRIFLMGNSNGELYTNGTITINDTGIKTFLIYDDWSLAGKGNTIHSTGDIIINSITSSDFEIIRMSGDNGKAIFDGDLYINSGVANASGAFGYRLFDGDGFSLAVNGNINVAGKYRGNLFSIGAGVSNSVVDVRGNISMTDNHGVTSLFYNNSSTSVLNFYGDITISANEADTTLLGGSRAAGSVTNFYGKIDTSLRMQETSFATGDVNSIVNFKGSVDNTFGNLGLRGSIFNLMNTNGSSAVKVQSFLGLGGSARVNIFGKDQLKLESGVWWELWGAGANGTSGIVNLNGTSLKIESLSYVGANRNIILDFGMTDHGMTSEQLAAQGITSEMINATGAGEAQTIAIGVFSFSETSSLDNSYVLIRNYIVGEDKILSYTKLSEFDVNGTSAYSDSVLEENIFRIEGYMDSEKYGSEYYLAEIETTDSEGVQCWEYYIIPEPADIAALIGAIALGFAFLRRKRA